MSLHGDVGAFDERAPGYDVGWLGRLHHEIADRTARLAVASLDNPARVLDIGCGTGYLLRLLASRYPAATEFAGVDPAPTMIRVARDSARDGRLQFREGAAEHLPFESGHFDLVVATTAFDHWSDQLAGLKECARVVRSEGRLILVDQFTWLLAPTLLGGRKGKARTKRRCTRLLADAGFQNPEWHDLYAVLIKAVVATPPGPSASR